MAEVKRKDQLCLNYLMIIMILKATLYRGRHFAVPAMVLACGSTRPMYKASHAISHR